MVQGELAVHLCVQTHGCLANGKHWQCGLYGDVPTHSCLQLCMLHMQLRAQGT